MAIRGQASVEYLAMFIVALTIMSVAAYTLLGLGVNAANLVPASCSFDLGINCQSVVLNSNASSTFFAFIGNNNREYPINNITLSLTFDGQTVTPQCTTGRINPGQTFVCFAKVGATQKLGTTAKGNLTAQVGYCSLGGGSCGSGGMPETYVGTYSTPVSDYQPHIGLVFSNRFVMPNGDTAVNVSFGLFNNTIFLGTLDVSPKTNAPPGMTLTGPASDSVNLNASTFAHYCVALVNVTYANVTGSDAVALDTSNYTQTTYKLASNSNDACLYLQQATKSVSVSGQNNTAGLFSLSGITITLSSTGGNNYLAVFNSNATLKVEGNYNNITMYNSNVVLVIQGTYNRIDLIDSRVSSITASGNNNLIILHSTSVGSNTITGTNDVILNA